MFRVRSRAIGAHLAVALICLAGFSSAFGQTQTVPPNEYDSMGYWEDGVHPPTGCLIGTPESVTQGFLNWYAPQTPDWTYVLQSCTKSETWYNTNINGQFCQPQTVGTMTASCYYYIYDSSGFIGSGGTNPARGAECPAGYDLQMNGDGTASCVIGEDNVCRIGNPVSPVTGAKYQDEVDYRLGDGTLELRRYYTSSGTQTHGQSTGGGGHWRFSFDSQILGNVGSNAISIRLGADGSRRHFDSIGTEILNSDGAASHLTVTAAGWSLQLPNSDVEQYDASGNLISVTTRAGLVTTVNRDASERIMNRPGFPGGSIT
jgi:YD repeat-containing protein